MFTGRNSALKTTTKKTHTDWWNVTRDFSIENDCTAKWDGNDQCALFEIQQKCN